MSLSGINHAWSLFLFLSFFSHFLGIASHNLVVIKCDCLGNVHRVGIHLHAAAISAQGILSFLVLPHLPCKPPLQGTDEMWQQKTQVHFLEIYQHPEGKLGGKRTIEKHFLKKYFLNIDFKYICFSYSYHEDWSWETRGRNNIWAYLCCLYKTGLKSWVK